MLLKDPKEILKKAALSGNKAVNLAKMRQAGFHVPEFVVIPASFLQQDPDLKSLVREITGHFGPESWLAVRSSAAAEDGDQQSFAGLFHSFLNVRPDDLEDKIRQVFLSGSAERVLKYSGSDRELPVSVIIQRMCGPEISGVAFGLDPLTGRRDRTVINALYGLGEALVSGRFDSDTYTVKEGEIEKSIVPKPLRLKRGTNGSIEEAVPPELQDIPCLSDAKIYAVKEAVSALGKLFGKPQDAEFCFEKDKLTLLQSRPVTAVAGVSACTVWDNSNIVESYPGVTTPLTFSFIIRLYEAVYTQFIGLMGVPAGEIEKNSGIFKNMLGLIRGRVYYNLLSWYKALALLPGYTLNAPFMEKMMGVKERFELPEKEKSRSRAWVQIVLMLLNMIRHLNTLEKQKRTFLKRLNEVLDEYNKYDLQKMPLPELLELEERFEALLLKEWKAPLINDFFAMIFFGLLQKTVEKACGDGDAGIHNDLLCGSSDIISAEPAKAITGIISLIRKDHAAREMFLNRKPGEIWESLPELPELERLIRSYLDKFGDRCLGELKLETVPYSMAPEKFIAILQGHVKSGLTDRAAVPAETIRMKAEAKVRAGLTGLKKVFFGFLLRKTRLLVSNRENLRFERTRAFAVVRRIFRAAGFQLHRSGLLNEAEDIFYLTREEIFAYKNGLAVSADLKSIVAARKKEFEMYRNTPAPPERIESPGDVYALVRETEAEVSGVPVPGDIDELKGIGCCPGIVRGKVRVILDPSEAGSLAGDILVTSSTDPGWVTLFPSASAILVERGSLLSHSAIVSREMGIPCVVGITGLLKVLRSGDEVELNGSTGKIKILRHARETAGQI